MNTLRKVRSLAIAKANTLQRAHAHLADLQPAFGEWSAGEIYVCRKSGQYRYRFGAQSKSVAPWDALAREIFTSPEAFAFAALVLGEKKAAPVTPKVTAVTPRVTARPNVVALAA